MLPVLLVRYETDEEHRNQFAEANRLTSQEQIKDLQAAALAKLTELQDAAVLCEAESFGFAIACWKLWGGIDEPARWLGRQLEKPHRIWSILRRVATIETSGSTEKYVRIDVKWLCEFVSLAALDAAVANVAGEPIDDVQQSLLRLFGAGRQQFLKTADQPA